jgi:hypothetical protein
MKQMITSVLAAAILALGFSTMPASAAMLPASPAAQQATATNDGGMVHTVRRGRHFGFGGHHHRHRGFGFSYGYRPYHYYGGYCRPVRRCWWDRWGYRHCRWVRRC